jgi:hypothetical protein
LNKRPDGLGKMILNNKKNTKVNEKIVIKMVKENIQIKM